MDFGIFEGMSRRLWPQPPLARMFRIFETQAMRSVVIGSPKRVTRNFIVLVSFGLFASNCIISLVKGKKRMSREPPRPTL